MSKASSITKKWRETRTLLKIISVGLAIFLWFFVLKSQPVSIEETLNIEYILPDNYNFSKKPNSSINVYLEGLRATLRRSDIEKTKVRIRVPRLVGESFSYVAEVPVSSIPQPAGVKVKDFHPKKIKLSIEKSISKKVPVFLKTKGVLSNNLNITSRSLSPNVVLVSGAKSIIKDIDAIETSFLDLSTLRLEEGDRQLKLLIPPLVEVEELQDQLVSVRFDVEAVKPVIKDLLIPIKFITKGNEVINASIKNVNVNFMYLNTEKNAESFGENFGISVFADLTADDTLAGRKKINLKVVKPENVKIIKMSPMSITID